MNSAGSDGRLQVLQERLHCQNVGSLLPWRLDHQLGDKHGLLANLLSRVLQFLVDAATDWTETQKRIIVCAIVIENMKKIIQLNILTTTSSYL